MGKEDEMGTWVGSGVGTLKKDGSARLNNVAAIFEYEVDPQGGTRAQLWEWK